LIRVESKVEGVSQVGDCDGLDPRVDVRKPGRLPASLECRLGAVDPHDHAPEDRGHVRRLPGLR
jgi:hypothetical protein